MYVTFVPLERCVAPNTMCGFPFDESAEYSLGGRISFDLHWCL